MPLYNDINDISSMVLWVQRMNVDNVADDKVAGRWLLATHNRDLSMSTPVFKEAMSAHICLPSPAIGMAAG